MGRKVIKCKECGRVVKSHAKGMCFSCYRKQWTPPIRICKKCDRERPHHAYGLCKTCHNKEYHYDKIKGFNCRKRHNISFKLYKKLTKKCIICGFDKVVELHHLDRSKKNRSSENLIGLCPNHHKMLHNIEFRKGIFDILEEKLGRKLNIKDLEQYRTSK
ncbi:MAG: hypothetical protein KKH88_00145 [Nanoarchaeota archaeon]|nr:hypothetical protein [Nanoarchaeota archaeon]